MNRKNKRKKSYRKKKRIGIIIIAEIVALLLFLTGIIFLIGNPQKQTGIGSILQGIQPENAKEPEDYWIAGENSVRIEPKKFLPSDYDFTEEEVTVEIPGLQKAYKLAWVSDLHLISDHEAGDVQKPFLYDLEKRYETLPVTKEGIHAQELWPEIVKYLNAGDFDAIIFGGDIMDYCSTSNAEIIREGLNQLYAPYLYIRADHDYGAWYGGGSFTETDVARLHVEIDGDNQEKKYIDFGDFIIVGVNGSTKDMPNSQLYMIQDLYNLRKPIIAVTHVPYASEVDETLEAFSYQVRNKIYYWGGGDYIPNDNTKEYLHMIYREDTKVAQVLAGHMHASWDGMLTEQVPEHIFGPAFEGNIGIIHVIPSSH